MDTENQPPEADGPVGQPEGAEGTDRMAARGSSPEPDGARNAGSGQPEATSASGRERWESARASLRTPTKKLPGNSLGSGQMQPEDQGQDLGSGEQTLPEDQGQSFSSDERTQPEDLAQSLFLKPSIRAQQLRDQDRKDQGTGSLSRRTADGSADPSLERVLRGLAAAPALSLGDAETAELGQGPGAGNKAPQPVPRIEGYELLEELGHGGMGVVYKARQKATGLLVAVKVILNRRSHQPSAVRRFRREIQLLARLKHPGIASILAAGQSLEGDPYFALELVEGVTLAQFNAQDPPLRRKLEVFRKLCEAVAHSHRLGILHRDLKPQNVLVTADGIKVLDFGLGRLLQDEDLDSLTQQGSVQGTIPYMSPEQINGEPLTTLSDLYSLGVILYELVCDARPYLVSSQSLHLAARTITEEPPKPPSKRIAGLPRKHDLDALILKALEKQPAHRYQSVDQLSQDIEAFMTNRPVLPRQIRLRAFRRLYTLALFCRRNRAAVAIALISVLALGTLGIWSFRSIEQQRQLAEEQRGLAEDQRQRAEEQRSLAEEQRGKAETSARQATRLLADLYEEQGRQALLVGEATRAAVYFGEAYRLGKSDASMRLLLGLGAQALQNEKGFRSDQRVGVRHATALSPDGSSVLTIDSEGAANLWARASGKLLWKLADPEEDLHSMAFSFDGTRLVSNGVAGTVKIWDAASRQLLQRMEAKASDANKDVIFTPDGHRLLSVGVETQIWDADSGKLLASLETRRALAGFVPVLSEDGSRAVLTALRDKTLEAETQTRPETVQVVETLTGRRLLSLEVQATLASFVSLSPDGKQLFVPSLDSKPQVLDATTGALLSTLQEEELAISSGYFSPDGSRLVTFGRGKPGIWDTRTGKLLARLHGEGGSPLLFQFSPDGKTVMAGGSLDRLGLWDVDSGRLLASLPAPDSAFSRFSTDGRWLLNFGLQQTAVFPNPRLHQPVTLVSETRHMRNLELSADGTQVSLTNDQGDAELWDTIRGQRLAVFQSPSFKRSMLFHPDGRWLAAVYGLDEVRLHDGRSGVLVSVLQGGVVGLLQKAFLSRDGRYFLTVSSQASAQAWDLETGRKILSHTETTQGLFTRIFSADGSRSLAPSPHRVAVKTWSDQLAPLFRTAGASFQKSLQLSGTMSNLQEVMEAPQYREWQLLDTHSGNALATVSGKQASLAGFSADGSRAFMVRGSQIEVLDARTGAQISLFDLPWGQSRDLTFSPNGQWIALIGHDDGVRLVNSSDGGLVAQFAPLETTPVQLQFSADATKLAVVGEGGRLTMLPLPQETRTPEAYARLLQCTALWRLDSGRLVPSTPPADCTP